MPIRTVYNGRQIKRITDLGLEKLCPGCDEWWPQTPEFFTWISTRNHYHNRCRAFLASAEAARRATRKAA